MTSKHHVIDYAEVVVFSGSLRGVLSLIVKGSTDDGDTVTLCSTLGPEKFDSIFKQLKRRNEEKHSVISIELTDDDDKEEYYYVYLPGKDARSLYKMMRTYKKLMNL